VIAAGEKIRWHVWEDSTMRLEREQKNDRIIYWETIL